MTEKVRKGVSVDETVAKEIDDDPAPFSPLVNKWASDYYHEGRRPLMAEEHVKQMLAEVDRREAEFDEFVDMMRQMFDDQRQMLRDSLGEKSTDDEIEAIYNKLTDWRQSDVASLGYENYGAPRDPNNPAIRTRARELGMSPGELVDELRKRDCRDGFIDERVEQ